MIIPLKLHVCNKLIKKILKILAKRVKNLREENTKSLNAFVFKHGVITTATLSRIENALVDVKFTTLVKLAQVLGISLEDLFKDVEFPIIEET